VRCFAFLILEMKGERWRVFRDRREGPAGGWGRDLGLWLGRSFLLPASGSVYNHKVRAHDFEEF
jgi:hypothetical protein